jgi:membrane protease YdiL (CAAX protease family)
VRILTLTPEAHAYAVAAVVAYTLGAAWLAGAVQARLLPASPAAFLPLYVAFAGGVAACAVAVFDLPSVTDQSSLQLSLALPIGAAAGAVAVRAESAVGRAWRRRSRRPAAPRRTAGVGLPPPWAPAGARILGGGSSARPSVVLALLLAAAVVEEVLFRGVLVELSLALASPPLVVLALAGGALGFALVHAPLGLREVLMKLPLGLTALGAALALGSVAPAVVAHAVFNVHAWHAAQALPRPVAAGWPR